MQLTVMLPFCFCTIWSENLKNMPLAVLPIYHKEESPCVNFWGLAVLLKVF